MIAGDDNGLICLGCKLDVCDEADLDCDYQNAKPVRTVAARVTVPVQIARKRAKWAENSRRHRSKRKQMVMDAVAILRAADDRSRQKRCPANC